MMESKNQRNIDGCLISLPEGLKELAMDITREVLRAQPQNVCEFIATYLSALLEVRSKLTIAGKVCEDIQDCSCHPELDDELRRIGLIEEDVETAMGIINHFFERGGKETNLFLQLSRKTSIEEYQLAAVQGAVRKAFHKNHLNKSGFYQVHKGASQYKCVDNISSTSLAGSLVTLPKHTPYSVHNDTLSDISERTYDSATSKDDESNKYGPNNYTIDNKQVLDKENVIRFKTEVIKYINDDEIGELINDKASDVESDALSVKTDLHYDTSSSD